MKHPSDKDLGWKTILQINMRLVFACLILFYGWLCWQMASIEWWGFYLLGPMCFLAGGIEATRALYRLATSLFNLRLWKRFQKLGNRPKADGMARDQDFESRGRMS